MDDQEDHLQKRVHNKEKEKKFCKQRTKASAKEKRKTIAEISNQFSDRLFCRTYLMSKATFTKLASVLEECVGDDEFKSELEIRTNKNRTRKATDFRGGGISDETRLTIAIRMLSSASYLDLLMVCSVCTSDLYTSFNTAIKWINDALKMPLATALINEDKALFQHLSNGFSVDSDEIFVGCIGAIDGSAVKTRCPTVGGLSGDGNPDSIPTLLGRVPLVELHRR